MSDDKMREEYRQWIVDAAERLGKKKLTVDEERIAYFAFRDACASKDSEIEGLQAAARFWNDKANDANEQLAAKDKALQVALDKFSHIKWIKDCGIDSSQGNHPEDERDAMYNISCEAITLLERRDGE